MMVEIRILCIKHISVGVWSYLLIFVSMIVRSPMYVQVDP